MNPMTSLDRAIAYWSFGWMPSDKLPGVALEALQKGIESPSIIELASADSVPDPGHHRLFEKVLAELGRSPLTKAEAGRIIAREYAEQICKGRVTPVEGARAIWKVCLEADQLSQELGIFGGRVSEYEGLPAGPEREGICNMIVSEAMQLRKREVEKKGTL